MPVPTRGRFPASISFYEGKGDAVPDLLQHPVKDDLGSFTSCGDFVQWFSGTVGARKGGKPDSAGTVFDQKSKKPPRWLLLRSVKLPKG